MRERRLAVLLALDEIGEGAVASELAAGGWDVVQYVHLPRADDDTRATPAAPAPLDARAEQITTMRRRIVDPGEATALLADAQQLADKRGAILNAIVICWSGSDDPRRAVTASELDATDWQMLLSRRLALPFAVAQRAATVLAHGQGSLTFLIEEAGTGAAAALAVLQHGQITLARALARALSGIVRVNAVVRTSRDKEHAAARAVEYLVRDANDVSGQLLTV